MKRLRATIRLDVYLQSRNRLYVIGLFVSLLLGSAVRFLFPIDLTGRALAAFYLLGIGSTTFMFGASMLLLEKGERTLEALRTSMLTTRDYVGAKVITLSLFVLVESAIVYAVASRGIDSNIATLVLATSILAAFYTLVGIGLAASYESVTHFLLPMGVLVASVLQLPFLWLLNIGPAWLWYLIPTQAPLLLLVAAFEPISGFQWFYALAMSATMCSAATYFCFRRFRVHIGLSGT